MNLYFDTRPEWIEASRAWGGHDGRVAAIWIFGSRAKGVRTPKEAPAPIPDLDVGYTLTGHDAGERLAYAMFEGGRASEQLQAVISVPLDLQYADPDTGARDAAAITGQGAHPAPACRQVSM